MKRTFFLVLALTGCGEGPTSEMAASERESPSGDLPHTEDDAGVPLQTEAGTPRCLTGTELPDGGCSTCTETTVYSHPARTCTNGVDSCTTPARPDSPTPLAQTADGAKTDGCSIGYFRGPENEVCTAPSATGGLSASEIQGVSAVGNELQLSGYQSGYNSTNVRGTLKFADLSLTSQWVEGRSCQSVHSMRVQADSITVNCSNPTYGGSTRAELKITFSGATLSYTSASVGGSTITSIRGSGNTVTIAGASQSYGGAQSNSTVITLNPVCTMAGGDCRNNPINGLCPGSLNKGTFDVATPKVPGQNEDGLLCFPANVPTTVCR